jgi:hypothetical protein
VRKFVRTRAFSLFSTPRTKELTIVRKASLLLGVLAAAVLMAPAAQAAGDVSFLPAVDRTLSAASKTDGRCDSPTTRGRGTSRTVWTAPMAGFATIRLRSTKGSDWDLGVFGAGGHRLAGSMAFGPREVAQTWVKAGERLTIKGCRRSGRARQALASITLADVDLPASAVGGTPQLVTVKYGKPSDLEKIESLGVDLTHDIHDGKAEVLVANDAQRQLLVSNGFDVTTKIADLTQQFNRSRAADARYSVRMGADGSPLPSGRTTYRVLTDYQADMKDLADRYPSIVKPITLPKASYQGRPLDGLEISRGVRESSEDGRPVYFVVALHHAREWPSAEAAMEFAIMLAKGYGSNARITNLLTKARVVVVPLINPDGFVSSRGFPADPADILGGGGDQPGAGVNPNFDDPCAGSPNPGIPAELCAEAKTCVLTGEDVCQNNLYLLEGIAPPGGIFSYRRKNCAGAVPNPATPCEAQYGVDPNRNYGQYWGGPGSDADVTSQSHRGPGPWSETETQAVHEYSQRRQITTIITLHNVAALVLRPPGTSSQGKAPDEDRLKQIGDAMADATGYTSQYGFQLYDTAGTTEDWNYAAAGAYGYTIEIGPAGGEFHMPYETGVVKEYLGTSDSAHGRGGLAEALLTAGEAAANPSDHSVITGETQPGRTLRLRKDFKTPSWGEPFCKKEVPLLLFNIPATDGPRCLEPSEPFEVDDFLETTLKVPASGVFSWHVNPSTRPFLLKDRTVVGQEYEGRSETFKGDGQVNPSTDQTSVHEFQVTPEDAAQRLQVDLTWDAKPEDFDLNLCRVVSATQCDPIGTGSGSTVGSSGNPNGIDERVTVAAPPVGTYRATVVHYTTVANDYTLTTKRFKADTTVVPARKEPWILTCEDGAGKVLQRAEVIVDRGQTSAVDLSQCGRRPAGKPSKPPKKSQKQ